MFLLSWQILRRLPQPPESGCRIFDEPHLSENWLQLRFLDGLALPRTLRFTWSTFGSLSFITKCLKRPQRWRGFHSLPQNGGRICFGVLSYFILKGNWHLKLRINCLKMGEVFLSKWSHITSSCDINIYRSVMGALSHYLKSDETMICLDVQLYFSPNNADADADQMLSQRTIIPRTVIFDQIS